MITALVNLLVSLQHVPFCHHLLSRYGPGPKACAMTVTMREESPTTYLPAMNDLDDVVSCTKTSLSRNIYWLLYLYSKSFHFTWNMNDKFVTITMLYGSWMIHDVILRPIKHFAPAIRDCGSLITMYLCHRYHCKLITVASKIW